jgi:hypothetical protein
LLAPLYLPEVVAAIDLLGLGKSHPEDKGKLEDVVEGWLSANQYLFTN